jgi:hypothetical protein
MAETTSTMSWQHIYLHHSWLRRVAFRGWLDLDPTQRIMPGVEILTTRQTFAMARRPWTINTKATCLRSIVSICPVTNAPGLASMHSAPVRLSSHLAKICRQRCHLDAVNAVLIAHPVVWHRPRFADPCWAGIRCSKHYGRCKRDEEQYGIDHSSSES